MLRALRPRSMFLDTPSSWKVLPQPSQQLFQTDRQFQLQAPTLKARRPQSMFLDIPSLWKVLLPPSPQSFRTGHRLQPLRLPRLALCPRPLQATLLSSVGLRPRLLPQSPSYPHLLGPPNRPQSTMSLSVVPSRLSPRLFQPSTSRPCRHLQPSQQHLSFQVLPALKQQSSPWRRALLYQGLPHPVLPDPVRHRHLPL